MNETTTTILVPLLVAIIPAIIAYFGVRYQVRMQLDSINKQHEIDLLKLKQQQTADLQHMRAQQDAEIQKIREQSALELEKMKIEIEKQAELYEKNAQTDVTKDVFLNMLLGDQSALDKLSKFEQIAKRFESGNIKNTNHPANVKNKGRKKG